VVPNLPQLYLSQKEIQMNNHKTCKNCNTDISNLHQNKTVCSNECFEEYHFKKKIEESHKKYPIGTDYINCKICGLRARSLPDTHFKKRHNISVQDYKEKYSAVTISPETSEFFSNRVKGKNNLAYQHNGKLSAFSTKFKKYENLSEEEIQEKINIVKQNSSDSKQAHPERENTHIEYWLSKGFSEEDAKRKLSNRQATFTIENCIERYGEYEGHIIWKDRQDRWQNTLNAKPQEDIDEMNSRKAIDYKNMTLYDRSELTIRRHLPECFDMNIGEITDKIIELYSKQGMHIKIFNKVKEHTLYYSLSIYFDLDLEKIIEENFKYNNNIFKHEGRNNYNLYDELTGKLLRSSYEIEFCLLLQDRDIEYEIEKHYPNSRLKSDFYLPKFNKWVEIAGMMGHEDYVERMKMKQDKFGSVILTPDKFEQFFEDLFNEFA
jgi:DNA-dependent RNA polymerase auxiliary subunit epsilon